MNYNHQKHKLLTFIHTKQILQSVKDNGIIQSTTISTTELSRIGVSQRILNDLINEQLIIQTIKLIKDVQLTLYDLSCPCVTPDFSLFYRKKVLNELQVYMMKNLSKVSLSGPGITMTLYHTHFFRLNKTEQVKYFFVIDNFSNRIHTPITNLKSTHRHFLLLNNQPTIELDLAFSQPLFLSQLLKGKVGTNQFSEVVDSGTDVYVWLQQKFKLETRKEAKLKFFYILFSKPNRSLKVIFGNESWIIWINLVKTIILPLNTHSKKKPHSNLAWLLQREEVRVMTILWQNLKHHKILFLTVHDSVIVPQSKVSITKYLFQLSLIEAGYQSFKIVVKDEKTE